MIKHELKHEILQVLADLVEHTPDVRFGQLNKEIEAALDRRILSGQSSAPSSTPENSTVDERGFALDDRRAGRGHVTVQGDE